MNRCILCLALLGTVAVAVPSLAAQRAFVATTGSDANAAANCSLALPCRSFGAALSATDPDGEIVVLDSGGYGRVTIDKSVAIAAPAGVFAGISVFPGTNGIDIAGAGIRVTLRGLAINGQGGDSGIAISKGSEVAVERCTISNMTGAGIEDNFILEALRLSVSDTVLSMNGDGVILQGGTQHVTAVIVRTRIERSTRSAIEAFNNVDLHVAESTVSGNSIANGFPAISVLGSSAPVRMSLDAVHVIDNGSHGIQAFGSLSGEVSATITRSTIARNHGIGVIANNTGGASASISVTLATSTVADNFGTGVQTFNSAGSTRVVVSESSIVNNAGVGLAGTSGTLYTRGNNTLRGNHGAELSGQTSGTITTLGPT